MASLRPASSKCMGLEAEGFFSDTVSCFVMFTVCSVMCCASRSRQRKFVACCDFKI